MAFLIGVTGLVDCAVAGDSSSTSSPPTSVPEVAPREVISLSISLFLLVDDDEEPDPTISTRRAEGDLREILLCGTLLCPGDNSRSKIKNPCRSKFQLSALTATFSSKMPGWLVLESAMKKATRSWLPSLSPLRSRSNRNWT